MYNPKHDRLQHQQGIAYVLADNNSVTIEQVVILMADAFPNENNIHSHEVMLYKCEVRYPIARNTISYINHDCCQDASTCVRVCVCACVTVTVMFTSTSATGFLHLGHPFHV